ncbi:hypothetical protein HY489_04200 [Candidatus Woesearchaeota archaeon]|nr:hypothetical protein [Candidatus Woesearchaeota archaeon]
MYKSDRVNKKGQEIPGWMFIIGIILGLLGLGVLIYIAMKSGRLGSEAIGGLG